jgi:hypothetical protein
VALTVGTDAFPCHACEDRGVRASVVIVDDHEDFRASASALLESEGFAVVGGLLTAQGRST